MIKKYPLALMQQRMYIYSKMYPNDPSYNMNNLFRLNGEIDHKRLIESVEDVYNSYEIFKVNFISEDKLYQVYDSNRLWKLNVINIENFNSDREKVEYVINDVNQKANEAIDLSKWPVAYVYLYKSEKVNFIYFKMHHIVIDVYSGFQLLDEISKNYNNETFEREKAIKYFDLEDFPMDERRYNRAIKYFKDEIGKADTLSIQEITVERNNDGILDGENDDFEISTKIVDRICKKMNASEFQVLLSVYALMIRSLTRNDKFIVGIPVANRKKEFKNILGLYINNLPLKFDFSEIKNFSDLITTIKTKMNNILRYQEFDLNSNMELLFDDQNKPSDFMNNFITFYKQELKFNLHDIISEAYRINEKYLNFPLSFVIEKLNESYILHVRHTEQFNLVKFGNIFENIISQIDIDNQINLNNISVLNKEEQKDIIKKLNGHDVDKFKVHSNIISIFEEISNKYPQNIAVKFKGKTITYKEFNELTNKVAKNLVDNIAEHNIVISMELSIDLIIMIISIFKSGKTYIPIDSNMPIERKKVILDQLTNSIIFTEEEYRRLFFEYGFNCINVREWIEISKNESNDSINKSTLDSIAYILFTSGSTGIPKGVVVDHKNVSCLHESLKHDLKFSSDCKWTLFHSYGFDYSIFEIIGSLTFGGELVIVPTEIRKFADEYRKFLIDEKINILTQTPSALANLIRVELNQKTHHFHNMKYVIVAAEPINFVQLKPWTDIYGFSSPEIYNMYGVTEAAVASTYHKITPEDISNEESNIIGKVLLGTDLFVGDNYGNVLPYGFNGELYISGESVGKGYFHNDIQTNKRFSTKNIINPASRIFKTGDLVKINDKNELIYLNRIDNQVQIRGHRVETGEITKSINSFPKCIDSVVIAHEFGNNDTRLIGYYIVKENTNCTSDELLNYLKTKLQAYMIPSFLIEIDKKPVTVNGKVDTKNLPVPNIEVDIENLDEEKKLYPEDKVLNIWKKVLKNNSITLNDNFFDVGGTSVLIAQVYYDILNKFHLTENDLLMIDLFDFSTPKEIGGFIDKVVNK